jgi:chemotaxis protein methyltransferase CheR
MWAMVELDAWLAQCLAENDPVRRRRLMATLPRELGPIAVPSELAAALFDDDDISHRTAAMEICVALGEWSLALLEQGLHDSRVGVRRRVTDVLAMMTSPRAVPLLRRALSDEHLAVRTAALEGITRLGRDRAGPFLIEQLENNVPAALGLVALLGIEQLDLLVSPSLVRRWLGDPLTAGAALRVLGRAGELADVLDALQSTQPQRFRAAMTGLAVALERGNRFDSATLDDGARTRMLTILADDELEIARAALLILSHSHDLRCFATAIARVDVVQLLPPLHRAVSFCQTHDDRVIEILDSLAAGGSSVHHEAARELELAARRRQAHAQRTDRSTTPPVAFSSSSFSALAEWFAAEAGLAFGDDARARLEARLLPRLETRGAASLDEYLEILRRDVDEAAVAIDAVTVHETYFFRETASLDGLRDDIAPRLATLNRPLRVWSAGCSSGEEAFTIAMILAELERVRRCGSFSVTGTDVSRVSVATARKSTYGPRSFRAPLSPEQAACFDVTADGSMTPHATLRARVRFSVLNLVDSAAIEGLPQFDVIFCRNVLIYMTPLARRHVLHAFYQRLRPGGALVLGHAESLLHIENPFELWPLKRGLAYRRGES